MLAIFPVKSLKYR